MPPSASQANHEKILEKEVSWSAVKWTKADLFWRDYSPNMNSASGKGFERVQKGALPELRCFVPRRTWLVCREWVKDELMTMPGPSLDVYAFDRSATQRNLYRIRVP